MIVYADVLIAVNLIVDFFLVRLTLKILKIPPKVPRLLMSAGVGALSSLYIFFPPTGIITEMVVKLLISGIMMLVACKHTSLRSFLRSVLVFFGVTCGYGGIMIALWQIFSPKGMVINNSVVYFNISPLVLTLCTVAGYFIYIILSKVFEVKSKTAARCEITLYADMQFITATAILDTGNSITDALSDSQVVIGDRALCIALFGSDSIEESPSLASRFRALPCRTVSGEEILSGFRCDKGEVRLEDKIITLIKPILIISKTPIRDGYSAILNPQILNLQGEKNEKTKSILTKITD